MGKIITTAGRTAAPKPKNVRKSAIASIRAALRNKDATDSEVDDALDALVELAKSED
jgi:hypothetical protein